MIRFSEIITTFAFELERHEKDADDIYHEAYEKGKKDSFDEGYSKGRNENDF